MSPASPRTAPRARSTAPVGLVLAAGLLLACARNPAFEDSGADGPGTTTADTTTTTDAPGTTTGSTSTTSTTGSTDSTGAIDSTAATGPQAPCPDDLPPSLWYPDLDQDGHGDGAATPVEACEAPADMTFDHGDCNDEVAQIHPGAPELCNGVDDDCNEQVDESSPECAACVLEITADFVYAICPEPGPISFDEAAQRCLERTVKSPVQLTSVHDAAEHVLLINLVAEHIAVVNDEQHAWIGGRKLPGPDQSCAKPHPVTAWRWIDASPFDWPPQWAPGEPNNESCDEGNGIFENCIEIKLGQGDNAGWNDVHCDEPIVPGYICRSERDLELFPD